MKNSLTHFLALLLFSGVAMGQIPPGPGGPKGRVQPPGGPFGPKGPAVPDPFDNPTGLPPELANAFKEAFAARQPGPKKILLSDVAEINLTAEMAFIPAGPASSLMNALGNQSKGEIVGVVTEGMVGLESMTVLEVVREGHVADNDADNMNADSLIDQIRKGTEEANKMRAEKGIPSLHVEGWDEKPRYDKGRRMLVWSILAREEGLATLNFSQILLGRDSMLRVVTVGERADAQKTKLFAKLVVDKTSYVAGKGYEDFQPGVDKVAEYGLTALIVGLAAKKLGLIAAVLVFLAKAWKLIAVVVVVVGGGLFKLFTGKKETPPDETTNGFSNPR
ncbi:MAG: DUF2167 domain-containing protein [Gemmataceae bacterium]|nr:DUF2167 domain-containing protein [Gemmataceae bacterium]